MTSGMIRFQNGVRSAFNVGMILGKDTDARYDNLYIYGSKGHIRSEVEYNQQGDLGYRIFTQDGIVERKVSVPQNYSLEIALKGIEAVEDFYRSINMPTNLRELGVEPTEDEIAEMAKKCAIGVGGEMGSAKVLNEEAMLAIYRASM